MNNSAKDDASFDEECLLSGDDEHFFREQGYLVLKNVIDENYIHALMNDIDTVMASGSNENRDKENGTDGYRNFISHSDTAITLLTWSKTFPVIIQLLGPHIQLMTSHAIHYEPLKNQKLWEPHWHTDIYGVPQDIGFDNVPMLGIKCAFCLSDHSQPNSGMTLLVPRSNHSKVPLAVGVDKLIPGYKELSLKPGDAFLFENRTWHGIGKNLSIQARRCLMIGYSFRWLKPIDYLSYDSSFLAKLTPLQRDLLSGIDLDTDGKVNSGIDGGLIRKYYNEIIGK